MGQVQKELTSCINANLSLLKQKKVGLFLCAGSPDPAARIRSLETVFPAELYSHAAVKELFGYELQFEKMGFMHKIMTKTMKGDNKNAYELNEAAIDKFALAMV
jgi:menaquinone-dependent protoporphyrinogen oxidase